MKRGSATALAKAFLPVLQRHAAQQGITNMQDVMTALAAQVADTQKKPTVEIITAREIPESLLKKIADLMKKKLAVESVTVDHRIDPNVLGGFIARAADLELDASIRQQLNQLYRHA